MGICVRIALIYAVGGTYISIYLGRPLVRLSYESEKREADFRYSLVRFRDNTEGIAHYKGEAHEKKIFRKRFSSIVENFHGIINRMLFINTWNNTYTQFDYLAPYLLGAPRLFAKEITFGGFMQTAAAFRQVSSSLAFIITNYPEIATWRATTNRLLEFKLSLESNPRPPSSMALMKGMTFRLMSRTFSSSRCFITRRPQSCLQ